MSNKNKEIYEKYGNKCVYCGCMVIVEDWDSRPVDHVIPKSCGGKDTLENLRPVCIRCNSSKWAYSLCEWRERITKKRDTAKEDMNYYNKIIKGIGRILS